MLKNIASLETTYTSASQLSGRRLSSIFGASAGLPELVRQLRHRLVLAKLKRADVGREDRTLVIWIVGERDIVVGAREIAFSQKNKPYFGSNCVRSR